jgi:predicted enzyme related to lactoylglutathione lyase
MSWVHAVIDVPTDQHAAARDFWSRAFGWPAGDAWQGYPELRSFEPPQGSSYLHLQEIDGAPRVHVDLETDDPRSAAGRATDLGATVVRETAHWRTLQSPGGLPFCLVHRSEHEAPDPVSWPGGHRSRMVQVCIDSPRSAHDAEVAFWRAFLPGRWVESDSPEFAGKWHDDAGSPIQLLMQRLDEPSGAVRAHLDLGTDDVAADARRLLDLGAEDIGPGRGWHALRDPAGLAFCTTLNSPDQVTHRHLG